MTAVQRSARRPSQASLELRELLQANGVLPLESLVDLGSGIAPQTCLLASRHVCVDAHQPYLDRLAATKKNLELVNHDLNTSLPFRDGEFQIAWLGDVVEHLEKRDGSRLFEEAKRVANYGVVIRSPCGYEPQEKDAWGMGGDHWQKHRSAWTPDEFDPSHVWIVPRGVIPGCSTSWFQAFVNVS